MSDWKSQYGVTDAGASNAGVYGTPNSTWDIARAQEETRKLQQSSWAQSPPQAIPAPVVFPTPTTPGSYPAYVSDTGSSGGCLKVVLVLSALGLAFATLPVWLPLVQGLAVSHGIVDAPALQTSHYESLSVEASTLARQPTSRLYQSYLKSASPDWNTLSPRQKSAVAAAWIRYTRNPDSFRKLEARQKRFVFAAFDSYLRALAANGDAHAARDLASLTASTR